MSRLSGRSALVLTNSDLAGLLRTSVRTLNRLNSAGKLPQPHRLGGQVRWDLAEIEDWLAAGMPDRRAWSKTRTTNKPL